MATKKATVAKSAREALADAIVARETNAPAAGVDIPDFLLVGNRKPLPADLQKKLDDRAKEARDTATNVTPLGKPKGMPIEEWEAHQSRKRQEDDAKKRTRLEKLSAKKPAKKELPKGAFTLRGLAAEEKISPKDARRVARANKDVLKPLEVGGKYVYDAKSRAKVLEVIKTGIAEGTKKKAMKTPKVSKKKVVIPPGGVFTGKAKVTRSKVPAPTQKSKKADDRKIVADEVKGRKKIKVEGGSMLIKKRKA